MVSTRRWQELFGRQLMAAALVYFAVYFAFLLAGLAGIGFHIVYFGILAPCLASVFINVYGIFPMPGRKKILLLALNAWGWAFVSALIAFLLTREENTLFSLFFVCLFCLIVVVIPFSLLLFQLAKGRIAAWKNMQEALGRSTADLQLLRSQINPHFLFNALNTIYGTAMQENAGRTADAVQRLGDMMRFMLHENHQDRIPMEREVAYIRDYIAMQQLRMAGSPDIALRIDIQTGQCKQEIAPMLLIPFVENAFKHGISLEHPSFIEIRLSCEEGQLDFGISNSVHAHAPSSSYRQPEQPGGEGAERRTGGVAPEREPGGVGSAPGRMGPDKEPGGIGLENVRQRLQIIYPYRHQLLIEKNDRTFKARLQIRMD